MPPQFQSQYSPTKVPPPVKLSKWKKRVLEFIGMVICIGFVIGILFAVQVFRKVNKLPIIINASAN
jgi:hypothetical protein